MCVVVVGRGGRGSTEGGREGAKVHMCKAGSSAKYEWAVPFSSRPVMCRQWRESKGAYSDTTTFCQIIEVFIYTLYGTLTFQSVLLQQDHLSCGCHVIITTPEITMTKFHELV